MIERVVVKQFIHHADQNGLLPVRQSACRRFHSTESAVLIVHNDIVRAIDEGHVAALALLDHSSAFDSADHSTLLSILRTRFSVTELISLVRVITGNSLLKIHCKFICNNIRVHTSFNMTALTDSNFERQHCQKAVVFFVIGVREGRLCKLQ